MKMRVAVLGLAVSATMASAQMVGVSHPDEVPVNINPDSTITTGTPKPAPTFTVVPTPTAKPVLAAAAQPVPDELRLSPNADANIVTRLPGPANSLPSGTIVSTRILEEVSTKATVVGTPFSAELTEPVMRDGRVLLPVGALLTGRVTEVYSGKRISGGAALHLAPISVTMPDGTKYAFHGQVVDTGSFDNTKVDAEGTLHRRDRKGENDAILGLTTGAGAATGALVAGPVGAAVGAAAGAGVSTVMWLKQDRQTGLERNTKVVFALTQPLTVGVE